MGPDSKLDTNASETFLDTSKRLDLSTIESPILVSERKKPLGVDEWEKLLDSDGRVVDESALRKAVFKGLYVTIFRHLSICLFLRSWF